MAELADRREPNVIQRALIVAFSHPGLAMMMFLEYAIWGAWQPPLSGYLTEALGYPGTYLGWVYAALPLAVILSPFTGGQVADRWLPAQVALGLFQLGGGILLVVLAFTKPFSVLFPVLLVYSILYAPTLALTNALALKHVDDPQRDFGAIRVWGTLGWIAAGLLLSLLRRFGSEGWAGFDAFLLAGAMSLLMGVLSFGLPHTPPAKEAPDPLAFRRALVLLKNPSYLVFFIVAFIVATELQLYYVLTFPFLQEVGKVTTTVTSENIPAWMTIAQFAEIFVMAFLLPYALPKWGVRTCMLIGIIAWPIRYFVFAATWPLHEAMPGMVWASIASLALHGFCYVFFFVVAFIYTDMVAPPDIRASAQALINVAVLGVGLLVGSLFSGWLKDFFTEGDRTNWFGVFIVPAVITVLGGIIFALFFRDTGPAPVEEPADVEAPV